jgi:hypothetical protein
LGTVAGGVAYQNSFIDSSLPQNVFVFPENLSNLPKFIADAASHEVGHALGVGHVHEYGPNGEIISEYLQGNDLSGPIMGNSYNSLRSIWWTREELTQIALVLGAKPDDYQTVTPLSVRGQEDDGIGVLYNAGFIGYGIEPDRDIFTFSTRGLVTLSITAPRFYHNLDIKATLLKDNTVIAVSNPENFFDAGLHFNSLPYLPAGQYTIIIEGASELDVGSYSIQGIIQSTDFDVYGSAFGSLPEVTVVSKTGLLRKTTFLAFNEQFLGGVNVSQGDINGDNINDIIVSAGPGAGPHVKVFDGVSFKEINSFFAFDKGFNGGVTTSSSGRDIIVAAGPGAGPHVKVFDGITLEEISSFFAYDPMFSGGVQVSFLNGRIITDAYTPNYLHRKEFDVQTLVELASYFVH